MPNKEDAIDKEHRSTWISNNIGISYTQAFDIRKVMYRIQNFDLPFKRGVRVEQFLMFFAALLLSFISYFVIISPIFGFLHFNAPWSLVAVYFLAPAILLSIRIGKPMPHAKSIFGTVTSYLRYKLDDEWHRRGMPMRKAPNMRAQGNYLRTWTVDPAFAGFEEPNDLPATDFLEYSRIDLPDRKQSILTPEELKAEEARRRSKRFLEHDEDFYDRIYNSSVSGGVTSEEDEEEALTLAKND